MDTSVMIPLFFVTAMFASNSRAEGRNLSEQQVPKPILQAFHKSYPSAADVGYEKDIKSGKPVYEVDFKDHGVEREVTYAVDGTLVRAEQGESTGQSLEQEWPLVP